MRDTKGRFNNEPRPEKRTGKILTCKLCKKKVYIPKYRLKSFGFCSTSCSAKFNYKNMTPPSGENHYNWKGGRNYHKDGYVYIYSPNHKYKDRRGYVFEHRLIMGLKLDRDILPEEHVHHINGIKDDNRIENLMIMSNSEHLKYEWKNGTHMQNASKTWIKKGQHLSPATEFKKGIL